MSLTTTPRRLIKSVTQSFLWLHERYEKLLALLLALKLGKHIYTHLCAVRSFDSNSYQTLIGQPPWPHRPTFRTLRISRPSLGQTLYTHDIYYSVPVTSRYYYGKECSILRAEKSASGIAGIWFLEKEITTYCRVQWAWPTVRKTKHRNWRSDDPEYESRMQYTRTSLFWEI